MDIDYGTVVNFKDRSSLGKKGFGFLSKTINEKYVYRVSKVYFHITQVKTKYPQIAKQLDTGMYHGMQLWYTIVRTERGEQADEIWQDPADIPENYRKELMTKLEQQWLNMNAQLPNWLDTVTLNIGGKEYREALVAKRGEMLKQKEIDQRLEREQEAACKQAEAEAREQEKRRIQAAEDARKRQEELDRQLIILELKQKREQEKKNREEYRHAKIRQLCLDRKITTLVHFTRIENLDPILKYGLLSRDSLTGGSMDCDIFVNDSERIDGFTDAICLSVSFPNYKMFYTYRMKDKTVEWVIALLDASILWELDCAFCQENAASNNIRFIPLEERRSTEAFELMFSDGSYSATRQELRIPDNYPTDPQAEVLVFDPIPLNYFKAIHFMSPDSLTRWKANHGYFWDLSLEANNSFFSPRRDYDYWR